MRTAIHFSSGLEFKVKYAQCIQLIPI